MRGVQRRQVGAPVRPVIAGPVARVLVVAVLVALVTLGVVAGPTLKAHALSAGRARRDGAPAAILLRTSVLSPSRAPRTLQYLWAQRGIDGVLRFAMSRAVLGASARRSSCAEVSQDGQVLFQASAARPVIPASNMKLVTANALLDKLGPNYRFTTELVASSAPVDGVLQGDLYLVGGGDPLLRLPAYAARVPDSGSVYTDFAHLVALLASAGVQRVTGSVVGDESRYDSVRTVQSWPARYREDGDVGPLSALELDDGWATAPHLLPPGGPAPEQAAGALTELLDQAGMPVGGPPANGRAPAGALVLGRLLSPPLRLVLKEVLAESDNTAMELLTKELGRQLGAVGSTAAGVAAVRADLAADHLPLTGFVNVDGSGLSRLDRVTCRLLVAVLQRSGADGVLSRDLPVAGESGTLSEELKGTVAQGRVRAKTGTLDGVKALSGWALPLPGQGGGNPALASPVVFSVVLNGVALSVANPSALTDRFAVDVAGYPHAPPVSVFEPG